jgi:outer membrane biosynthesis protein TonB
VVELIDPPRRRGASSVTGAALRSSVLAALVLVVTGCATQSPETMPTSPQERISATPSRETTPTSPQEPSRRRGGGGRGGILDPPIALDSTNPLSSEYLEHVRQRIKERWGYPCVRAGQSCEYKSASVDAEFGILQDGRLQYVEILRGADFPIYDEYVLSAIKLASPFRSVPPVLMAAMRPGSTGIPIRARFAYEVKGQGQHLR